MTEAMASPTSSVMARLMEPSAALSRCRVVAGALDFETDKTKDRVREKQAGSGAGLVHGIHSDLVQPLDVLGNCVDLGIGHAAGAGAHDPIGIVAAFLGTERPQLRRRVVGVLTGEGRVLRGRVAGA